MGLKRQMKNTGAEAYDRPLCSAWSCTLVLALCLSGFGCSKGSNTSTSVPATQPAKPIAKARLAQPPTKPATITGHVSFRGSPPKARVLRMSADPYCDKANPGGAERRDVIVGSDGGLADVFVYIKSGIQGTYEPPTEKVRIDQHNCNYVPVVSGVMVGQPIAIHNSDATLHNVHAMPHNSRGFNMAMPIKGMTILRKFTAPEVLVRIKCDVHPWMETFVGVTTHPFFAVTAVDGGFSLTGLPAGDYVVEAVHPKLGRRESPVSLSPGGRESLNFEFTKR